MKEESINLFSNEKEDISYTCCSKPSTLGKIFTLSVLIVCFIVIIIVVKESTDCPEPGQVGSQGRQVCTSPACVKTSAYVLNKMNQSVDPCEDMYQYACGGWVDKAFIPSYMGEWGTLLETSESNMHVLKELIESEGIIYKGVNSSAIAKLKTYYRTCMDEETIEKQGVTPVLQLINKLGSWSVTSEGLDGWNRNNWTLQQSLTNMHLLAGSSLFHFDISVDAKNTSRNIITFYQSGLTLAHKDEYISSNKFREAFLAFAMKLAALLGGVYDTVTMKMIEVFEFETKLAKITDSMANLINPNDRYNKMTIGDFQNLLGPWVDIKQYLIDNFNGKAFNDNEDIIVATLSYFQKLGKVIEQTDKEVLANYMMWNMLQSLTGYFPDGFSTAALTLSKIESGVTSLPERWKRCIAKSEDSLGYASSALYVQEKMSPDSKTQVKEILDKIKHQFIINLDDVTWLDQVTRQQLKDKASLMSVRVGYPDWILDPIKLDQRYEDLQVIDGEFLSNKLQSIKQKNNRAISQYGKVPDREEWSEYPEVTNAFYDFEKNSIVVPAGILQDPFYASEYTESLVYGNIGMIVGHELTHGFDNTGRYYDKHGNLSDMWTQASAKAFQAKSQCMIDQYNAYKLQARHLNGALTLGENIADNGGLKFAFKAYKTVGEKSDTVLPGVNLTNDQLFFVGFSQLWCARYTSESELRSILTNTHANKAFRVIGSLSNSKDFAKAFNCDMNSQMNPKDKCSIW